MFKNSLFALLFVSQVASANSFILGHNLGITTAVPEKGTVTAGNFLLGFSPTDSCIVGTSPWMAVEYNSFSLLGRCKLTDETTYFNSSALQFGYIKSDDSLGEFYRQDVGLFWYAIENRINDVYTLFTTINYMYFWDETVPFSLRREPGNDQPWQISISTLHQVRWTKFTGFHFEFGILGLNYGTPLVHNGYSVYTSGENYLIQLGVSMSASPNNFDRLYERSGSSGTTVETYDFSVHPEVQLQYFF
jgi:hypothetical protein